MKTKNFERLALGSGNVGSLIVRICKACDREFPPSHKRDPDRLILKKKFKCQSCRAAAKKQYDTEWATDHKAHRALYMRRYRRNRKTTSPDFPDNRNGPSQGGPYQPVPAQSVSDNLPLISPNFGPIDRTSQNCENRPKITPPA